MFVCPLPQDPSSSHLMFYQAPDGCLILVVSPKRREQSSTSSSSSSAAAATTATDGSIDAVDDAGLSGKHCEGRLESLKLTDSPRPGQLSGRSALPQPSMMVRY